MTGPGPLDGLEVLETEGWGMGWLAPANEHQKHDLVLFDKKHHPTDAQGRPVFGVRFGSETPVCASKKRGRNAYCGDEGRMDNGRCKNHGGRSLRGMAHPQYRGKGRSIYERKVVGHLTDRVRQLQTDPELHHHRTSIAQIDAMVEELWKTYKEGLDPDAARAIAKKYRQLQAADSSGNRLRAKELFEELGQLIFMAEESSATGDRIVAYLEARRKHANSETRRKLSESLVFSLEEARTFYTALGMAVNKHVKDREVKRALLDEVAAIAGATRPGT
jgi:hypothetical protein